MNSNNNPDINEEEDEERQRALEKEWSSHVITTRPRRRGCFVLLQDITLLLEIGPSIIGILLGLWLLCATAYNLTLPVSKQVYYEHRTRIMQNYSEFNETCELPTVPPNTNDDWNGTADNVTEICFKIVPVSTIGTGKFLSLSFAMIVASVVRVITTIMYCRKFPKPDYEMVTKRHFLYWGYAGIACIYIDAFGSFVVYPLGPPEHRDFNFTNDRNHLFYYLCCCLFPCFELNVGFVVITKVIMVLAHILCKHTEVEIYA